MDKKNNIEESWQSFDVKGLNIITDANMPHRCVRDRI